MSDLTRDHSSAAPELTEAERRYVLALLRAISQPSRLSIIIDNLTEEVGHLPLDLSKADQWRDSSVSNP